MRPDLPCGVLAEPDRLAAAFSAVVLGASTPSEVVAAG
jgi:hypothetical protein